MLQVALLEPEIPPNTGNIARLCLATGSRLHLIGPLGFSLDEKSLRRAGMDYWHECDIQVWNSWQEFQIGVGEGARLWLFTTKAKSAHWDAAFLENDILVFGRESKGLPESLLAGHPDSCLRIPMRENARSLNLATSVGIALYETLRQTRPGGGPNLPTPE